MKTKILMIVSALFSGIAGLALTFLPQELLNFFGEETNSTLVIFLQLAGALYLGFGMMNWMAKANLIGGIYSRPLAMGNFLHYVAGSFAIFKAADSSIFMAAAVIYSIFAILFGYILFTHPIKKASY